MVRDIIDARIANEVTNGTTTYQGSVSGISGLIDSQTDVGGWPELTEESRASSYDSDLDGMPDDWENQKNLNPTNADDRNNYTLNVDYTNLEVYLNGRSNTLSTTNYNTEIQESIKCFPNPTSEYFHIDLRKVDKPQLEIYNSLGQLVLSQEVVRRITKIHTQKLPPSIYKVVINDGISNQTYIKKIVIR